MSIQTLTHLETLPHSPSLQLAYAAVALHLTAKHWRDPAAFDKAYRSIWIDKIERLKRSKVTRGLLSSKLYESMVMVVNAALFKAEMERLSGVDTETEAKSALEVLVKEMAGKMGLSEAELATEAVGGRKTSPCPRMRKLNLVSPSPISVQTLTHFERRTCTKFLKLISAPPISAETLTHLETFHLLFPPFPALPLAYSAVALYLTAKHCHDPSAFREAFDSIWVKTVDTFMSSKKAEGLLSEKLYESREILEGAVASGDEMERLSRRDMEEEAETAVKVFVKEVVENVGLPEVDFVVLEEGREVEGANRTNVDLHAGSRDIVVVEKSVLVEDICNDNVCRGAVEEEREERSVLEGAHCTNISRVDDALDVGNSGGGEGNVSERVGEERVEEVVEDYGDDVVEMVSESAVAHRENVVQREKREGKAPVRVSPRPRTTVSYKEETGEDEETKKMRSPRPRTRVSHKEEMGEDEETKKRRRWTPEEEQSLRDAVKKFGEGNWAKILRSSDAFLGRNPVNLKDKWRNMKKPF